MNTEIETSTTKIVDGTSTGLNDRESEKPLGKRGRENSSEPADAQSPRKMRKKEPESSSSIKQTEKIKLDDTTVTTNSSNKSNANSQVAHDKEFDFGNDSALLNDLLGDFDEDDSACGDSVASSKQNGNTSQDTGEKQTLPEDKAGNKAIGPMEDLMGSEFDGDFGDFFEETFQEDEDPIAAEGIDFQEFRYCKVVEIKNERHFIRLKVEEISEKNTATVLCSGFWRDTKIAVGDIVSIKAAKKSENWTVNNEYGFLVTEPHTLVSGTSVAGAGFCMRRSILSESFRGLDDLPSVEPGVSAMTIGTLVHEVFQSVLQKKLSTLADIRKVANDTMNSRRAIQMLYECNLSQKECKQKMEGYIPKIFDFVKRYIIGDIKKDVGRTNDDNFVGKIERIREIEENIWLPAMGLKGKIDVTVDVTVNLNRKIMPLEVKTGQPTFSTEHRGQLMLYNMMLGYMGHNVDAGLLLYIRDNIIKTIKSNRHDERDLIMLRNSFAYYTTRLPKGEDIEAEDGSMEKKWEHTELPEPINNPMACPKCPYNILCSTYAEKDPNLELPESHILKTIKKQTADFLTPEHIDYALHWITMTKVEGTCHQDVTNLKDLWIMEPQKREEKGVCVANLRVCGKVEQEGNKYLHTFVRRSADTNSSDTNLIRCKFAENDYILVSTNTRINVSAGYLKSQSENKIEMLLDRNIVKQNPMATFHLDRYPFAGLTKLGLANIGCLLNNHDITNKLRGIIIDKQPATFTQKLPRSVAEFAAPILVRLNKYQREAILKVLSANDYLLIRGMPGTGKTQTLVGLIELLVKMGQSVLITAHTHSAVDNILLKLDELGIDFLRLGSITRISPKLRHKSENVLTADCTSVDSLEAVYHSTKAVGITCYGAVHSHLSRRIFDVCVVDESTQLLQSTVLKPLFSAKKFVLVGDPEQLPPVVRNHHARKMGMDESLFQRLDSQNNTVTLKLQYRMNRRIMSIANTLTYKGAMKPGNEEVANATLHLKDRMVLDSCERWISKALSLDIEDSVCILNTGQTYALKEKFHLENGMENDNKRVNNVLEAIIVVRLVAVLLKGGINVNSIGVISPYTAQVELLRDMIEEDVEINTVDQYQGRDKEVILYSCTRSEPTTSKDPGEFEVLQDHQRLNVAMTRAKHKFIVVCDKLTLERYKPFNKFFSVTKDDIINLESGRDNFSWESLVQLIK